MQNYDLGRVFSRLFQMVLKCFLPASGFIAVCIIAMVVVLFLTMGSAMMALGAASSGGAMAGPEAAQAMAAAFTGASPILLLIGYVGVIFITSVLLAGIVDACLKSARGEAPTFSGCISAGMANCLKVAGFTVLWSLLLWVIVLVVGGSLTWLIAAWLGGLVSAIIYVVYIALFSPSIPALINEPETGVIGAFSRGLSLSSGHLGMIVLTLILSVLILVVGMFAFILVIGLLAAVLGMISQYLLVLLIVPYLALYAVMFLFMYGMMATIYAELKLVKEGGDSNNIANVFT
jgi:hypothetical protein